MKLRANGRLLVAVMAIAAALITQPVAASVATNSVVPEKVFSLQGSVIRNPTSCSLPPTYYDHDPSFCGEVLSGRVAAPFSGNWSVAANYSLRSASQSFFKTRGVIWSMRLDDGTSISGVGRGSLRLGSYSPCGTSTTQSWNVLVAKGFVLFNPSQMTLCVDTTTGMVTGSIDQPASFAGVAIESSTPGSYVLMATVPNSYPAPINQVGEWVNPIYMPQNLVYSFALWISTDHGATWSFGGGAGGAPSGYLLGSASQSDGFTPDSSGGGSSYSGPRPTDLKLIIDVGVPHLYVPASINVAA